MGNTHKWRARRSLVTLREAGKALQTTIKGRSRLFTEVIEVEGIDVFGRELSEVKGRPNRHRS